MFRKLYHSANDQIHVKAELKEKVLNKTENNRRTFSAFSTQRILRYSAATAALFLITAVGSHIYHDFQNNSVLSNSVSNEVRMMQSDVSSQSSTGAPADSPQSSLSAENAILAGQESYSEDDNTSSAQTSGLDSTGSKADEKESSKQPNSSQTDSASTQSDAANYTAGQSNTLQNPKTSFYESTALAVPQMMRSSENSESLPQDYLNALQQFSYESSCAVLSSEEEGKNQVYSPVSLYFALSILAEASQGDTQAQILDTLHMQPDLLRENTGKLFRNLTLQEENGTLTFANSLWLDNDISYQQDFLDRAAQWYYAYSYQTDFASSQAGKDMAQWVNEHTGGLLGNDPNAFSTDPSMVMSIINATYFCDAWSNQFSVENTQKDSFTLADGSSVSCDFMNASNLNPYFEGENYVATSLGFSSAGKMVFILPKDGSSPSDFLSNPAALNEAVSSVTGQNAELSEVNISLPKFSFETELHLNASLQSLGVTDAFTDQADFSILNDSEIPLTVSDVNQGATITVDENGCEAAAYTKVDIRVTSMPIGETKTVKLDRPFLFVLLSQEDDIPLFVGTVNNPLAS